ncbi:hypothetical protein D3C78_18900 [compost metagenome]
MNGGTHIVAIVMMDVDSIADVHKFDTVEHDGHIYACENAIAKVGDLVITSHPTTKRLVIADVIEVDDMYAKCVSEGAQFDKLHGVNAFYTLSKMANADLISEIISDLSAGIQHILTSLMALPDRTRQIVFGKTYNMSYKYDDGTTFDFALSKGYITAKISTSGLESSCKFSCSAKHDTIERQLAHTPIYQLLGEELVYLKNRACATILEANS